MTITESYIFELINSLDNELRDYVESRHCVNIHDCFREDILFTLFKNFKNELEDYICARFD